jgi:hypothetical protein
MTDSDHDPSQLSRVRHRDRDNKPEARATPAPHWQVGQHNRDKLLRPTDRTERHGRGVGDSDGSRA